MHFPVVLRYTALGQGSLNFLTLYLVSLHVLSNYSRYMVSCPGIHCPQPGISPCTGSVSAALEYVYPVEAVDGQESLPVLSDPLFWCPSLFFRPSTWRHEEHCPRPGIPPCSSPSPRTPGEAAPPAPVREGSGNSQFFWVTAVSVQVLCTWILFGYEWPEWSQFIRGSTLVQEAGLAPWVELRGLHWYRRQGWHLEWNKKEDWYLELYWRLGCTWDGIGGRTWYLAWGRRQDYVPWVGQEARLAPSYETGGRPGTSVGTGGRTGRHLGWVSMHGLYL